MEAADGSAQFAKKLGVDVDLSSQDMGTRGKRFTAFVENGVVRYFAEGEVQKCTAQLVLDFVSGTGPEIKVGDKIPEHSFTEIDGKGEVVRVDPTILRKGKVALFCVPGAFTPSMYFCF